MANPWPKDQRTPLKPSNSKMVQRVISHAVMFVLGGVLGLLLGLMVVKEARSLGKWWKDSWAPLTYASVGNFNNSIVYDVCAYLISA